MVDCAQRGAQHEIQARSPATSMQNSRKRLGSESPGLIGIAAVAQRRRKSAGGFDRDGGHLSTGIN